MSPLTLLVELSVTRSVIQVGILGYWVESWMTYAKPWHHTELGIKVFLEFLSPLSLDFGLLESLDLRTC